MIAPIEEENPLSLLESSPPRLHPHSRRQMHPLWMGIRPCPPLGLGPNNFLSVEAFEFDTSPILVSLLCGLKNHDIVGSALPV
jgi:hypothetical protein